MLFYWFIFYKERHNFYIYRVFLTISISHIFF